MTIRPQGRPFCYYYLDIETVPYSEFIDYPGASFDPSKSKIISIQYCPLATHTGRPIGPLTILKEWQRCEREVLELFKCIYIDNGLWSFIPVGNNLLYECKFLKHKFELFYGLKGLKLGQRPMIDIKSILVIRNYGKFKGSALSVGKTGEASNMCTWYYNKEFDKIVEYIIRETINFINVYCLLKTVIPEIKFPNTAIGDEVVQEVKRSL
jgi:hypothetical protein